MIVDDEEVMATIAKYSGRCILCGVNGSTPMVTYRFKAAWLGDQTVTLCNKCSESFEQLQEIIAQNDERD